MDVQPRGQSRVPPAPPLKAAAFEVQYMVLRAGGWARARTPHVVHVMPAVQAIAVRQAGAGAVAAFLSRDRLGSQWNALCLSVRAGSRVVVSCAGLERGPVAAGGGDSQHGPDFSAWLAARRVGRR